MSGGLAWCPTCRAHRQVIDDLIEVVPEYARLADAPKEFVAVRRCVLGHELDRHVVTIEGEAHA